MIPLTPHEALSGIFGSISLASWIFLLLPQLVENYTQGSAEGISLTFLFIWFVGDVTNLAGAVWAGLVPTVIALAVYFCFADAVLISQCLWYKRANGLKKEGRVENDAGKAQDEQTPLLAGQANGSAQPRPTTPRKQRSSFSDVTDDNLGLPGSHTRRKSSAASNHSKRLTPTTSASTAILERIPENENSASSSSFISNPWVKNTISVILVVGAGAAGWALAWKVGAWTPTPDPTPSLTFASGEAEGANDSRTPIGASILGYASAVCYLGARIPQIIKNQRERSCEGLSLLFFLLSLVGNGTYGAGILFHSLEKQYVLTNLPWLIGSLGTMAEDAVIFVQFSVFGERKREAEGEQDGDVAVHGEAAGA